MGELTVRSGRNGSRDLRPILHGSVSIACTDKKQVKKKETKHDVPCADKDNVEVVGATDVAHSKSEMRRRRDMEREHTCPWGRASMDR